MSTDETVETHGQTHVHDQISKCLQSMATSLRRVTLHVVLSWRCCARAHRLLLLDVDLAGSIDKSLAPVEGPQLPNGFLKIAIHSSR